MIINYLKSTHRLMIGEETAEDLDREVVRGSRMAGDRTTQISGRDLVSGLTRTVTIAHAELNAALDDSAQT